WRNGTPCLPTKLSTGIVDRRKSSHVNQELRPTQGRPTRVISSTHGEGSTRPPSFRTGARPCPGAERRFRDLVPGGAPRGISPPTRRLAGTRRRGTEGETAHPAQRARRLSHAG